MASQCRLANHPKQGTGQCSPLEIRRMVFENATYVTVERAQTLELDIQI